MRLSRRPSIYMLPSYSLTGDLLGFLRCGLQYRYTRIGQLPASRPVQMWFGQFIHGVLDEAYRQFNTARQDNLPPWPEDRIMSICEMVQRRLATERLFPWDPTVEELGHRRALAAINELAPELFPLIYRSEVRLTGARPLPVDQIPTAYRFRAADRYEMVGVVDVITHVQLRDPAVQGNPIVKAVLPSLGSLALDSFEVIIDYKGMRRPPSLVPITGSPSLWDIYGWQVHTYAHLRSSHADSLPVVAGVIVYLNELVPSASDLEDLRKEIRLGRTDVVPEPGTETERLLKAQRGEEQPELPLDFRLQRALRIVAFSEESIQGALKAFDRVVARIETCRGKELREGRVVLTWEKNADDESSCTACDARTFCPTYKKETTPRLPAIRIRPGN